MKITPWASTVMKVAVFSAAFAIPGTALASADIIPGVTQSTSANGSVLGGNQINLPVSAPVNICGNGIGVLGTALGGCSGGASVGNSGGAGSTLTSTALAAGSSSGLLPTTGADLAGMVAGGVAAIAAGVLSLLTIRRRRTARI